MKLKRVLCLFLVVLLALPACGKKKGDDSAGDGGGGAEQSGGAEATAVSTDFTYYQQSFMDDIVREVSSEDLVRDQRYVVDDAKLETLIDTLDFAVNSAEIKNLLGLDLGVKLSELMSKLYSNDIVNLAVQYLYPLVETEFAKVWSGLPESLELTDVETGVAVAPTANVNADLYIDEIEKALESIQFYLFPTTLADHLPAQYAAAAEKLRTATTKSKWDPETETMTTPWKDPAILTADGKLDIDWGVHDRDSFADAMAAALSGVEPLLMALLANKACDNRGLIGTGAGHAAIVGGTVKLDMQITSIELVLTATANPGYNNALVPIFEALGIAPPDGNTFTGVRDIVDKGLVAPLETLLTQVANAPVSFVLSALPNIAYAVEAGMVVPLLSMLKTEINYTTNAKYTVKIAGDGEMNDAYKSDEPIKINVGEMIDLPSMGVDISSLNGLLAMAEEPLGFALPALDGGKLATLGALTWRDTVRNDKTYASGEPGKAAYIEANRADVLLFLLDYVFTGLQDRTLLTKILEKAGGNANLPELVNAIIDRVLANPNNAIAALVELVIPQSYNEPNSVKWKEPPVPVNGAAVLYSDYWTHPKADYMVQNLPSLLDNVLGMAGLEIAGISASSLPELLDGLVASVCKASVLNGLAEKINGAVSGISLPEAVTALLKQKLGVDIHYWSGYHADFADGDRAAFKTAVSNLLYPVQKLVTFLLSDQDITISLTDDAGNEVRFLHLHGFDAYSQAIIPLLEALGAENLPTPAAFKSSGGAAFGYILDAIFGVIDGLKADPYNKIITLLPNVLCFLRCGGLTAIVDNLLYPVNLVLDIIRPFYDLSIYSLVDFDLRFERTDPVPLLFNFLSNLLKEKLGVSIAFNFTTESLYNALVTGQVETFTSANGAAAYRVNAASLNRSDMLTVIYDYLLKELLFSDNTPTYLQFAKEKLGLDDKVFSYVEKILPALKTADQNYPGSGKALIFWIFYVAEAVVGSVDLSSGGSPDVLAIISALASSGNAEKREFAKSELRSDFAAPGYSDMLASVLQPLFQ